MKETVKTITIAVLSTAIIAFVVGVKYQTHVDNHVTQLVKEQVSLKN